MSYIDTFDHELVGFFAGLPVYHPLEATEASPLDWKSDFSCTPNNLVIGGGSGEHPALILRRPDYAVAHFLLSWQLEIDENEKLIENGRVPLPDDIWHDFIHSALDDSSSEDALYFAGWNVETYHSFYERCTSKAHTPYDPKKDGTLENWLAACLGELLFFAMPDIIPDLDKKIPSAREQVKEYLYMNILLPPPGYPLPFGRIVENGKLVWGKKRW